VALCRLPGELACLKIPPMGRRKTTNTVRRRLPCRIGCRSARRAVAGSVTRGWVAARLLARRAHWRWQLELSALLFSFQGTLGPAIFWFCCQSARRPKYIHLSKEFAAELERPASYRMTI